MDSIQYRFSKLLSLQLQITQLDGFCSHSSFDTAVAISRVTELKRAERDALRQAITDEYTDLLEACEVIVAGRSKVKEAMERGGYSFNEDGGRWQSLAFTLALIIRDNTEVVERAIAKTKGEGDDASM